MQRRPVQRSFPFSFSGAQHTHRGFDPRKKGKVVFGAGTRGGRRMFWPSAKASVVFALIAGRRTPAEERKKAAFMAAF